MPSPLKDKPLRLPGQSLDEKLSDILDISVATYATVALVAALIAVMEIARWYWDVSPRPLVVLFVTVPVIVYCVRKVGKLIVEARNVRQGRDGERIVGQHLEELRTNDSAVFHDVLGENFNIDHVAILPQGVFTIETKTWTKRSRDSKITFDGQYIRMDGHRVMGNPIVQAQAGSSWLKETLKESTGKSFFVQPVVLLPGWFIEPESSRRAQDERGVWLLNPKALPSYIKNLPVALGREDLHLIAFHLSRYVRSTY